MIRVTQGMIDKGIPGNACLCPVAMAFDALPGFHHVFVLYSNGRAFIGTDPIEVVRFRLPLIARRFIDRFDHGKPVKPFEFPVPDELIPYLQTAREQA
jgi:hypothetical protein